ncbi:uncharacterized protein [Diabrotica undecimpunctata]|uniref:uncharacterized protein n=1 Tax=Diabrotica undecimpunctata TaxID=50387 RepID=UPI003B6369FD
MERIWYIRPSAENKNTDREVNAFHIPKFLAFIDYEKAFDSIELWAIEHAINKSLEDVFKTTNWSTSGINVNGNMLNHLRFADDILIIASTFEELQIMMEELADSSQYVEQKQKQ